MRFAASPHLSPSQLRTLRRLVEGGVEVVARRAGIVLTEHRRRTAVGRGTAVTASGGGAERVGAATDVTRQTAAKWYARFAQDGPAGLEDLPRGGRPIAHGEESLRAVLVAPLFLTSMKWTSHDIAEMTGQSQTAVVRAWRRAYRAYAPDALPAGGLALVAARVDASNRLLALAAQGVAMPAGAQGSAAPFMRSPRRPPLQVLLAADLLPSGDPPPGSEGTDGGGPSSAFVQALVRRNGTRQRLFVLSRRPVGEEAAAVPGVEFLVVPSESQWQGLLETLVRRCTATAPGTLVTLQQRLVNWAQGERVPFDWSVDEAGSGRRRQVTTSAGAPARPTGQVVADAILAQILARIAAGRLTAGDRITETSLSRAVHASRGHVREALLTLASNGLVELEPHRGALVPAPQVADVMETYAARRALGALLVRRAVHWAPGSLAEAEAALAALEDTGRSGDAWACGEADMRFQDALAQSTGMRRIPRMFLALSAQIRLFTAVMGVRYTYSIPAMVGDDTALLHHIKQRNESAALQAWHSKMDDALDYMVTRLGPPGGGPGRSVRSFRRASGRAERSGSRVVDVEGS